MQKLIFQILGLIALSSSAVASITINIFAGELRNSSIPQGDGALVANGTLLQLVDLGADGVFNPINLGDADGGTSLGQWVSEDDVLLNVSFGDPTFSSTNAFDLKNGADGGDGVLQRSFNLTIPQATKIGLRWFPGLLAASFGSITLTGTQPYGQFTRQAGANYGGTLWVAPANGSIVTFDSLATISLAGVDANTSGNGNITVIPEPGAIALSLMGAAGLVALRRRRA